MTSGSFGDFGNIFKVQGSIDPRPIPQVHTHIQFPIPFSPPLQPPHEGA